jgi:uncharacterized membrane protein (DUF373 family)
MPDDTKRSSQDRDDSGDEVVARQGAHTLEIGENGLYLLVGLALIVAALLVLAAMIYNAVVDLDDGVQSAVITALDSLLIVFILLELLAGVRATIVNRLIVAEPFLVAGIIASIKEIILLSIKATPGGDDFDDSLQEMAVLGVLVLLLAVATFVIRRKEREPSEE